MYAQPISRLRNVWDKIPNHLVHSSLAHVTGRSAKASPTQTFLPERQQIFFFEKGKKKETSPSISTWDSSFLFPVVTAANKPFTSTQSREPRKDSDNRETASSWTTGRKDYLFSLPIYHFPEPLFSYSCLGHYVIWLERRARQKKIGSIPLPLKLLKISDDSRIPSATQTKRELT